MQCKAHRIRKATLNHGSPRGSDATSAFVAVDGTNATSLALLRYLSRQPPSTWNRGSHNTRPGIEKEPVPASSMLSRLVSSVLLETQIAMSAISRSCNNSSNTWLLAGATLNVQAYACFVRFPKRRTRECSAAPEGVEFSIYTYSLEKGLPQAEMSTNFTNNML